MPRLRAEKTLDEYRGGKIELGPDALYDVVMEATGDVELANAYRVQAIKRQWKPR